MGVREDKSDEPEEEEPGYLGAPAQDSSDVKAQNKGTQLDSQAEDEGQDIMAGEWSQIAPGPVRPAPQENGRQGDPGQEKGLQRDLLCHRSEGPPVRSCQVGGETHPEAKDCSVGDVHELILLHNGSARAGRVQPRPPHLALVQEFNDVRSHNQPPLSGAHLQRR